MTPYARDAVASLQEALEAARDPSRAAGMAAYMRQQFPFLGIPTQERRRIAREALRPLGRPAEPDLQDLCRALYSLDEREYQYAAVDHAAANIGVCGSTFLAAARWMITTRSWWDTVDGLAARVAGPLVLHDPALAAEMDAWTEDANMWLARSAILHQLRYKDRTDRERLFRYCSKRAPDGEFFIRKAIGWALREYSKTDPEAVAAFVQAQSDALSGLSRREAMLWLHRRSPGTATGS